MKLNFEWNDNSVDFKLPFPTLFVIDLTIANIWNSPLLLFRSKRFMQNLVSICFTLFDYKSVWKQKNITAKFKQTDLEPNLTEKYIFFFIQWQILLFLIQRHTFRLLISDLSYPAVSSRRIKISFYWFILFHISKHYFSYQ